MTNRRMSPSEWRPLSIALGLIIGAAVGVILIGPTLLDGNTAFGLIVGAALGLLIAAVIETVVPRTST